MKINQIYIIEGQASLKDKFVPKLFQHNKVKYS